MLRDRFEGKLHTASAWDDPDVIYVAVRPSKKLVEHVP